MERELTERSCVVMRMLQGGVLDIAAFTMDDRYITEASICGLPVIPFEEIEKSYPPTEYDMLVAVGYTIMRNRPMMYEKAKAKGYHLTNYISPRAILENEIQMGDNNIILSNTVIGYEGVMGNGNFIFQNVYLGHGFHMGNHSVISAGCSLAGNCAIEDLVFIGIGVTSRGRITFGRESLIGVGSNVVAHVPPYATCYGNPAKNVGYHKENGVVIKEIESVKQ